jgi:hypothetical protein
MNVAPPRSPGAHLFVLGGTTTRSGGGVSLARAESGSAASGDSELLWQRAAPVLLLRRRRRCSAPDKKLRWLGACSQKGNRGGGRFVGRPLRERGEELCCSRQGSAAASDGRGDRAAPRQSKWRCPERKWATREDDRQARLTQREGEGSAGVADEWARSDLFKLKDFLYPGYNL